MRAIVFDSVLTFPHCGFAKKEPTPLDACQFFYECLSCRTVLRPLAGHCCVFCSFGSVQCPPIQGHSARPSLDMEFAHGHGVGSTFVDRVVGSETTRRRRSSGTARYPGHPRRQLRPPGWPKPAIASRSAAIPAVFAPSFGTKIRIDSGCQD